MFFVTSLMYMISFGIALYNGCRSHEENPQSELEQLLSRCRPSQRQILSSAPPQVRVHPRSNASPAKRLTDSSSVQASTPPSTQNGEVGEMLLASGPDDPKAPPSYESTLTDPPPYETAF